MSTISFTDTPINPSTSLEQTNGTNNSVEEPAEITFLEDWRRYRWPDEERALVMLGLSHDGSADIKDDNTPLRQALRLTLKQLLAENQTYDMPSPAQRRYSDEELAPYRDPRLNQDYRLEIKGGDTSITKMIGLRNFQGGRYENREFSPTANTKGDKISPASKSKNQMLIVQGYYVDPRLLSKKILTANMVREQLVLVETGKAGDIVDRQRIKPTADTGNNLPNKEVRMTRSAMGWVDRKTHRSHDETAGDETPDEAPKLRQQLRKIIDHAVQGSWAQQDIACKSGLTNATISGFVGKKMTSFDHGLSPVSIEKFLGALKAMGVDGTGLDAAEKIIRRLDKVYVDIVRRQREGRTATAARGE